MGFLSPAFILHILLIGSRVLVFVFMDAPTSMLQESIPGADAQQARSRCERNHNASLHHHDTCRWVLLVWRKDVLFPAHDFRLWYWKSAYKLILKCRKRKVYNNWPEWFDKVRIKSDIFIYSPLVDNLGWLSSLSTCHLYKVYSRGTTNKLESWHQLTIII